MKLITDITVQKKNKDRVSVFIDGEFFCGLDYFTLQKHRLKIGQKIDEQKLSEAVFESECNSAFEKCMRQISSRLRASSELEQYLVTKEYSNEIIQNTLNKLAHYNYLDDSVFAREYIASHQKEWGVKKLEYELKNKKIDSEIIAKYLYNGFSQVDEIIRLLEKFNKAKEFNRQKSIDYLLRKGFLYDEISLAISNLKEKQ